MSQPFLAPDAIRAGILTEGQLRWNYLRAHPRVYVAKDATATLYLHILAAWLWTGRKGVIAGRAAAALHGAKWIDASTPIEVITEHTRRRPGVIVHEERIAANEITNVGEMAVTTPARTAMDLGRHLHRDVAVPHLDALAAATGVTAADTTALIGRYRGARGIRRAQQALALMDSGAESPEESRLRLLLIDAGLPAPRTQIRVSDGFNEAFIDMGYDEPKVGLDYDGMHHSRDRRTYVHDIGRAELIEGQGWIDLRVVKEHSRLYTLHRVREAFARRGWTPPSSKSARAS
jgi:hypothetical protein